MSISGSSQNGGRQPAPTQQQGQSAPVLQQGGTISAPKPQIRDWASI